MAPLLLLLLLFLGPPRETTCEVGSPGFPPPNACALAGLLGTCSGCICCCGPAPGKPPVLTPVGCSCERELDRIDQATRTTFFLAAGTAVLVPALLALAWFGRCCCGTPFEEDQWEEV